MEQYAIKGGNPVVGEVEIGGAKNAALPILAASVMTDDTVYIEKTAQHIIARERTKTDTIYRTRTDTVFSSISRD